MNFLFFLFVLLQGVLSTNVCEYQPEILSTNRLHLKNSDIYFYIPLIPFARKPNSIIIYDDYGRVLDCLNEQDFIKQNSINADTVIFMLIKHIIRDTYSVLYLQFNENKLIPGDEGRIVFMDEFFNIKKELPIININNNVESSFFKNGAMNMHDIIVDESLNYAIIIIKEKHLITDAKELFPNAFINDFIFAFDGLCAIDLKTGKEIAAVSGNGVYVDLDQWWEYMQDLKESKLFFKDIITSFEKTEYDEFDSTYINALSLVDGSHFSSKYNNQKLILQNTKLQDTIYLLRWDFEKTTTEDNFEIIWKLPSKTAPEIIRKEWSHRWEYVNDPLYGPSRGHDLNIYNLPKGHILMLDNGGEHRTANNPNIACPMTRSVEYKIDMDANGPGYHKTTLVFSYPKMENYPKWIYLEENEGPVFKEEDCREFWKEFNYQVYLGSNRKTGEGNYVMTAFPYELTLLETQEEAPLMLKLDSEGNVINKWFNVNGLASSYRINPIKRDYFRNGLYARSFTKDYYYEPIF